MKKVLILVENFKVGGAQNMVCELVKNLDKERIDYKVICYRKKYGSDLEKKIEKYTDVEYLDIRGRIGPLKYIKVLRAINKFNPDIVHAHLSAQIFSIVWGQLHNKAMLITAHTTPEKAFIKKTEGFLKRGLKRRKFYIAAVSSINQDLTKKYFGIDDNKCFCVNNGIDISLFEQQEHSNFTFINVATHNENKNQSAILRCFARLTKEFPNSKLYLVGDGSLHNELINLAESLEISDKVYFPGSVADVENYYAISDAYVQASHREAMPLSVLEAMATSLPIISTNVGGLSDVVKDNGFLINDNEEELYRAMHKIISISPVDRKNMGRISYEIVQEYSSVKMAKKYMEIYEKIC